MMNYKLFNQMTEGSAKNRIIELLQKEALTSGEIAQEMGYDRTSIHYHLNGLLKKGKVKKVTVKKCVYYGLVDGVRV